MTTSLVLLVYSLLFVVWMSQSRFFRTSGLSFRFLLLVFASKLAAGLLYGYLHHHYFQGGDTFVYLQESVDLARSWTQAPGYYPWGALQGQPPPDIPQAYSYPDGKEVLRNLGTYTLIHCHALLQPFTQGQYILHLFFVAVLGLYASLILYKALRQDGRIPSNILSYVLFFMPSVLFWTSGLHKEVMIYLGFAFVIRALVQAKTQSNFWWNLALGLIIIGLFRHYLLFLLAPALSAYFFSQRRPEEPFILGHYLKVYALFFGLLVLADVLITDYAFLGALNHKRALFLAEEGGSKLLEVAELPTRYADWLAFMPEALINVTCRPLIWDCQDILQLCAALEILGVWGLFAWNWRLKSSPPGINNLGHFLLFYALSNLLLVGLLVGNVGTIVRYRAIALGFLVLVLSPALQGLRRKKLAKPLATPSGLGETKTLRPKQSSLL